MCLVGRWNSWLSRPPRGYRRNIRAHCLMAGALPALYLVAGRAIWTLSCTECMCKTRQADSRPFRASFRQAAALCLEQDSLSSTATRTAINSIHLAASSLSHSAPLRDCGNQHSAAQRTCRVRSTAALPGPPATALCAWRRCRNATTRQWPPPLPRCACYATMNGVTEEL